MDNALGAVSFDTEDLILVDSMDRVLGNASKKTVHEPGGQLHRAFSIFIYAAGQQVLLHKNSRTVCACIIWNTYKKWFVFQFLDDVLVAGEAALAADWFADSKLR